MILKNPADFVGSVLGESERNTKAILANSVGKVLVIDEVSHNKHFICLTLMQLKAYMLYGGASSDLNNNDIYKTAVIDTIVAEVQGVPGDDRCVLMLGYEPPMRKMFQVGFDTPFRTRYITVSRTLTPVSHGDLPLKMHFISAITAILN